MYDELVTQCRDCIGCLCGDCKYEHLQKPGNFVPCMNALLGEAADAIEELSKPRWIPVTELLPEHDKNVLICYEWTGRSRTVYREVGIASIEELERDPTEMFRPLYWMPLPQPPKEE